MQSIREIEPYKKTQHSKNNRKRKGEKANKLFTSHIFN